jgi:programmed cell death protein 5
MPQSAEEQQAQQAEAEARAEQRREALATLMDAKARERLSRIRLVKPDKATALENMLLQAAQRGQLGGVVTEDALIKMLEQVNGGAAGGGEGGGRGGPKITMARRRDIMDDDDW